MNTRPSRSLVARVVVGVVVPAVLWAVFLVGLVLVVPHYQHTFADFGLKLPAATEIAIAVTRWVANYWYVLLLFLPSLLAADAAIVVLLGRRQSGRGLSWLWSGLMVALPVLALALAALAIYLPLAKLQENLSK